MFKAIGRLVKRLTAETTPAGKIIRGVGAIVGLTGTVAVANEITLTNDFILDIVIIVAITVITVVSGQAQVPDYFKDRLRREK